MVDPDLAAQRKTVADRVEVIDLLEEEGPLSPRDIVDALVHSRATVYRALEDLREADLIEKQGDGYTTTLLGGLSARQFHRYEAASNALFSAKDLLTAIPEEHAPPVELLIDADISRADVDFPVRLLETVVDRVQNADTVRAYFPTLVNPHLLRVWHRTVVATTGTDSAIFDPNLLTVLKGQYPHLLSEMAASDNFTAFATSGPPYAVILTETRGTPMATVIVYEGDAAVQGVLTNDSSDAVDWARAEFDRLRNDASEVTADLNALSAAVADGLAQSPRVGSGAGSAGTANGAAGPVAGHALPIDLEAEGFVRLSQEYFDTHSQAAPEVSWRTGFTLLEVRVGHAVDRYDDAGRNLTEHLVEKLQTGTDHVVLGPPGAGKSTICMAVACEWYNRGRGPVLYRERGTSDHIESTAMLEAYLRQIDGHALVVVEDAVRDEANAIFEVMQAIDTDQSVTFLLDSRTHQWRDPDSSALDARLDAYRRSTVEQITVPDFNERDCERFVSHYTDLIDDDLDMSGAELYAKVRKGTATAKGTDLPAGEALVMQHNLSRRFDAAPNEDAQVPTALEEAVRRTYEELTDADAQFALDLAVLIALLTAAGIPIADEYLHALAVDDDHAAIDEAITLLKGRLIFTHDDLRRASSTYRTRHETWALRFLKQVLDREPTHRAREQFGRCVTHLLALADDTDRRNRIQHHLSGRTPHLHQVEADPQGWADELIERIFGIGQTDASLSSLFGETGGDTIELPDACSVWMQLQQAYWRGKMNRIHGDFDRAEREFRTLADLCEEIDIPDEAVATAVTPGFLGNTAVNDNEVASQRKHCRATVHRHLGQISAERKEFETAVEHYEEAILLFHKIDDQLGRANSLNGIGAVKFYQGDYDKAREHYENALTIAREFDNKKTKATCLNNLGIVAELRGDSDQAREYYEEALAIDRNLGDRKGQAYTLANLGTVTWNMGDYDNAHEYHKRSLMIKREFGDQPAEAKSLDNLGQIAEKQGDYDKAREYYEEAIAIKRDIGDHSQEAYSIGRLGMVACLQGDHELARDHLDQAREIFEDVGDRRRIAENDLKQAKLALAQDNLDQARDSAQVAYETLEDLEQPQEMAQCQHLLGRVAAAMDATAEAREHWQAALETFKTVNAPQDALTTIEELVEICQECDDDDQARKWLEQAQNIVADAPEAMAVQHRDWIERHAAELNA